MPVPVSARPARAPLDATAIWDDLHGPLLGFIVRRVRDRDTAEDILQDVMLRIHGHGGELERSGAVVAWVHRIARNAIVDHYRRAAFRREQPSGVVLREAESLVAEPAAPDVRAELAACLGPLLARLPPAQRQALVLTELEGMTQVAAAARLGLSTSGMKSRVQRARAQLKDMLLACCEIELDRRAGITSYRPRAGTCACRSSPRSPPG
jgi:RNA polymerase sigma-70 factor (ECF subfamily)